MLTNKTIVLGVSGGIAAYKAADLSSKLTQAGAKVRVIMTRNAREFITPLTFEAITTNAVITDMFQTTAEHRINHIALSEIADAIVIAPATANVIAKIAGGLADEMLTTTVLATRAPVIIVPAMHTAMWENQATRENIAKLRERGFHIIEPANGRLASGGYGAGRFRETEVIIGNIKKILGRNGDLSGKHITVTAGGTQEPIDPVRVITNRSSGKMGYAIAEAARDRGANVDLITTPTALARPVGVEVVQVETAAQMKEAVEKAVARTDALIMAAAVADYQVAEVAENKIKKEKGGLTLDLINTPDILSEVNGNFLKIGFAAESQDLIANARKKVKSKNLDLIAANNITEEHSGFGTDTNKVVLIGRDGMPEDMPLTTKREVAERILDRVVRLLKEGAGRTDRPDRFRPA
ncbi:MAG: bifunctional phosphopantothenoylcysteine decarboxylase/phosphopantothenate--cysteine ligase CoaBC [Dehalococcoidales bacterium]|nr:bifunctional phosphopantothenoylcysteine decarboxylase/phosphopantothenate--cysteine ligase CoaBC [Dehalococcoidales bacterium]